MNETLNDEEQALINLTRRMRTEKQVGNIHLNFYQVEMAVVQVMFSYKKPSFISTFCEKIFAEK
jgi:hypothetical protein